MSKARPVGGLMVPCSNGVLECFFFHFFTLPESVRSLTSASHNFGRIPQWCSIRRNGQRCHLLLRNSGRTEPDRLTGMLALGCLKVSGRTLHDCCSIISMTGLFLTFVHISLKEQESAGIRAKPFTCLPRAYCFHTNAHPILAVFDF